MLNALKDVTTLRPGFEEFARFCKDSGISLVIVSAGLDFVVKHVLEVKKLCNLVTIYMPRTRITTDDIEFKFPRRHFTKSVNFKHDLALHCKSQGHRMVFIGDGNADFPAAKEADITFVIKGSRLEELCKKENIPFKSISNFSEVLKSMGKMRSEA
jgi:2-hydroxy-3-keto-5-methylthiopentenyl-1-phosphate phosphatase